MSTAIEYAVIERELRSMVNHFHAMAEQPTTIGLTLAYLAAAEEVQATIERLGATLTDGAMAGRTEVRAWTPATDGDDDDRCKCHERDGSYVCKYCYAKGFRGHMEKGS